MGDKKTRKGLDTLRGDIQSLTEVVADLRDKVSAQYAFSSAEHFSTGSQHHSGISKQARNLGRRTRDAHEDGAVGTYGYFERAGEDDTIQVFRWSMEDRSASAILDGPIGQYAHILAAIGHPQRLNILLMLLAEPATANDVVSELSLGTTGAAYHHLNVLQAAGFVEQEHRGIFTIVPNRVPTLLTILASLSNGMEVEVLDHLPEDEDDDVLEEIAEFDDDPDAEDDDIDTAAGPAA